MPKSEIKMKMSLDSSGVKSGLAKAKAGIKSFASSANQMIGSAAKMGMAALAASFVVAAKSALDYGKEMKNLSRLANTNFKDFQKLAAGAKTVGIEQDKLADIYKDTSDKVGDFLETGGGPMADYFENIAPLIGQTADEFRGLSGPDALQKYYNGLQQANVSQETMTFYMEAIASDSTALVPLLQDGGAAFKKLGDDAEASGMVMSDATSEALAEATNQIDKFKTQATIYVGQIISGAGDGAGLKAFGYNLLGWVTKAGESMLNGLINAGRGLHAALSATVEYAGDRMTVGFKVAALELKRMVAPIVNDLLGTLNALGGNWAMMDVGGISKEIKSVFDQFDKSSSWVDSFAKAHESTKKWNIESKNGSDEWHKMADAQRASLKDDAERIKNQEKLNGLIRERTAEHATALDLEWARASGDNVRIVMLEREIAETKKLNALMKDLKIGPDEAKDIMDGQLKVLREEQGLREGLLHAQVAQRADLEYGLNREIKLRAKAMEIAESTGKSYSFALLLAKKIMKIEAGPDLNQSGFATKREQRAWEKQQKVVAKQQKEIQREEVRKENRPLTAQEHADDRAAKRKKAAEDRELNRRKSRGEKAEDVLADIQRRNMADEMKEAERKGEDAVKELKDKRAKENAAKADADKKPKKPENAVIKEIKPIMENQLKELVKINKALKCEG